VGGTPWPITGLGLALFVVCFGLVDNVDSEKGLLAGGSSLVNEFNTVD
jgi:hypothetical protein